MGVIKNRTANRVVGMQRSAIRRYSALVQEMGGVNLSQGVCDLPAPPEVKRAAKEAIDADQSIYTDLRGLSALRQAIADKMLRFNGLHVDPESELVVTCGAAGAFACIAMATLNPGDEVICFSPFYNYYPESLALLEVTVRFVDTQPPDWQYSEQTLATAITDRTRMIVVNTPCNPTGKVFTRAELGQVARLAAQHDLWILTDEIYEYITFGVPHVSIARLPDACDRTFTVSGPSKTYSVTGWRIGWAAGPADVMEKVGFVNDMVNICAPAPLQHGVLAGLGLPDSYYRELADGYRERRDLLTRTLTDIGCTPYRADGAFYILAGLPDGRFADATEAAETMLNEAGVATVPAQGFFRDSEAGARVLRVCFAKSMDELADGCQRLRAWAASAS